MTLTVSNIVLAAKKSEIMELRRLKSRSYLVGSLSHMIHMLQSERGASSIFLASSGKRFEEKRLTLINESEVVEALLRKNIEQELENSSFSSARIIALLAWVLVGLDALPEFRQRISDHRISGRESVTAFSRLIAGLISLIFEVADAAVDPSVSRLLVTLFNLVEGKEFAGQERAVGALAFASGQCDAELKQRIFHLIDAQQRSFRIFLDFADESVKIRWYDMQSSSFYSELKQLRQLLRNEDPGIALDPALSDIWFDSCSERISCMWSIQHELVDELQKRCDTLIAQAEEALLDSEGLLQSLRQKHPFRAGVIDRFFDPDLPVEQSLGFIPPVHDGQQQAHSLIDLLQAQSQHLANMESELSSARRALNERKIIERAKGILMVQFALSEEEAFKKMRTASMQQNRRLVEVAESVLSLKTLS